MFLMATSAIGPGFITQTTQFTAQLGAAFAFAILVSIVIDVALQLNVWRVIGVSGLRAQELGNRVLPGLGHVLTFFVVLGGFVFNVGNVAGAGLGIDAMCGLEPRWGGALSALLAIGVFLSRRAGVAMDRIVVVLGFVMIAMTGYVAIVSHPPAGAALRNAVWPAEVDLLSITTLVGGTVGGYITYAGAHRLLDAGVRGGANVAEIARASVAGVLVTGVMRTLLFLAVLGVVAAGVQLDPANPAASAFEAAAGDGRAAGLWLDPLVGGDYVRDRRLLYVGLVSRRFVSGDGAVARHPRRRLHHRVDAGLRVRRHCAGAAPDLCGSLQWLDSSHRRGSAALGGSAATRLDGWLSIPACTRAARRGRLARHYLSRL